MEGAGVRGQEMKEEILYGWTAPLSTQKPRKSRLAAGTVWGELKLVLSSWATISRGYREAFLLVVPKNEGKSTTHS